MHSPARSRHLDVVLWIAKLMHTHVQLQNLGIVHSEKCLCSFTRNDYEPDVVYFGSDKASAIHDQTLRFPVPDLIVEVLSASTEATDRGVKMEDFAASGVAEYWIVDADQNTIEQYLPKGGVYSLHLRSSSGRIRSQAINGFKINIPACFDANENLKALKTVMG